LYSLKISDNVNEEEDEPNILIVSGRHSSEICTVEYALWIIENLTSLYDVDPDVTKWVNENQIYISPNWNPDGREFEFTDPLYKYADWRKNRNQTINPSHIGVDLNRNFETGWDGPYAGSTQTFQPTYKGNSSNSELETKSEIAFIQDRHFAKSLDMHSVGKHVWYTYHDAVDFPAILESYYKNKGEEFIDAVGYDSSNPSQKPKQEGCQYQYVLNKLGGLTYLLETSRSKQASFKKTHIHFDDFIWNGTKWFLDEEIPLQGHVREATTGKSIVADISIDGIDYVRDEVRQSEAKFGRYHYFLPPGIFEITFSADGYLSETYTIKIKDGESTNLEVTLDNPNTDYLIITQSEFANAIQPLADWHYKEGFKTEIVTVDTPEPQEVKDIILDRFNDGSLEYVLLVGDHDRIPAYQWGKMYSDSWFACLTVNDTGIPDLYADVAIGRISGNCTNHIENQVSKILKYEKDPPTGDWLNNAIFATFMDTWPMYEQGKEKIRNNIIPFSNFLVETAYGRLKPNITTNDNITKAINNGLGVVNYYGHGTQVEWEYWTKGPYGIQRWHISDVDALNNGDKTPIVFNMDCFNHAIHHPQHPEQPCLGEAWVRKYPGGAVASIGATFLSNNFGNEKQDNVMFKEFCKNGEYRLGHILNAGTSWLVDNKPQIAGQNARIYLLLGDPATEIWTDIPNTFTVKHTEQIMQDLNHIKTTVTENGQPISDATVCLFKEDDIY